MINSAFGLSIVLFPILVIAYLVCYSQFYSAIRAQRPEWLHYKGEPSIFYAGMPRRFDPNISLRAIAIAFTPKAADLGDSALAYARAIRVLLPAAVAIFGFVLWFVMSKG